MSNRSATITAAPSLTDVERDVLFARKMVAELWSYPDGSRILELSTKSTPKRAVKTVLETRELLAKYGVSLDGAQQTKTKTALEFFAKAVS